MDATTSTKPGTVATAATAAPWGRRIHVLQVVGNGIVGGMETWVLRLAARLPREQFDLSVLCAFEGEFSAQLRALGVPCHVVPMPDSPAWASVQEACALVRQQGVDVLHAHLPNAHVLAGMVGKLVGCPVVTTVHGRQVTMLDLEVQRLTHSHISTVCRQSYYHALGVGVAPALVGCIPNGVDTSVFLPRPAGPRGGDAIRALFDPASGDAAPGPLRIAGFVGRLSPEKGPEVFVRAAMALRGRFPELRFVMVGDGPMRAQLDALVAQYGLSDLLRITGVRGDMPAVYHALDVLVSTSHSEAMPLAVMEGMASGLPVVATWVGGVPELVEQGRTGWLASAGNFDSTANLIAKLLADPAEAAQMGRRGRERVQALFNLDVNIAQVAALYQRLAAASLARAGRASAAEASILALGSGAGAPAMPARHGAKATNGHARRKPGKEDGLPPSRAR